ncbi:MAG: GFA family protein [Roseovarius sp.]
MLEGSCLCGAVAFEAEGPMGPPIACHCKQCRQQSGFHFSALPVAKEALRFRRDEGLAWYRHTEIATRGFCRLCGSTLFWRGDEGPEIMVAMGSLEKTEGLRLSGHYWVDFKGDYYRIADGLPQHEGVE